MKTFSNDVKSIKITFVCDACGENTVVENVTVPADGETTITGTCPVCFKEFDIAIHRKNGKSWVEIEGISDSDITIS